MTDTTAVSPSPFSALNSARLLEDFFKDFYYELLVGKEQALRTRALDASLNLTPSDDNAPAEDASGPPVENDVNDADKEQDQTAANTNQHPLEALQSAPVPVHAAKALEEIQERLKAVFAAQTSKVVHLLDQTDSLQFKDAQYAMAALADEVFLSLPWHGRTLWAQQLLESQLFQSQTAGTVIFSRIDDLLSKYDPSRKNLAVVYFYVLALGFKGTYSEAENLPLLKNYEARLYAFVYGKNPSLQDYSLSKLVPACYASTFQRESQPGLPDVRFWSTVMLGTLFLLFLVSYMIWYDTASDLHATLKTIFDQFKIQLNS